MGTETRTNTNTITVRFRGICCFIDPENGAPFKKRVVLPNGKTHEHAGMEPHRAIIEYYSDELTSGVPYGLQTENYSRPGDDAKYQRIELDQPMIIEFINVVSTADVSSGPGLNGRAISLDKLVQGNVLKRSLMGPLASVSGDLAKVAIDLPGGTLMAGPPEAARTSFNVDGFVSKRFARWLELIIEVNGPFGLRLTPIGCSPSDARDIYFAEGTGLVTIANEPVRIITGRFVPKPQNNAVSTTPMNHSGMGASTATATRAPDTATSTANATPTTTSTSTLSMVHFDMYWDLMADPAARPLPAAYQGSGPSCSPATKP
jgi:hypothetical protein